MPRSNALKTETWGTVTVPASALAQDEAVVQATAGELVRQIAARIDQELLAGLNAAPAPGPRRREAPQRHWHGRRVEDLS